MSGKTVVIKGEEFCLDSDRLVFNEASLTKYLQEEAAWYNHVAQKQADADAELKRKSLEYEVKYAEKFRTYKEQGGSDKLAESNTKADIEVEAAANAEIDARLVVDSIKLYLRALDKSHDNAQSYGHFLRKEMDKLMTDIRMASDNDIERKINDIVGG